MLAHGDLIRPPSLQSLVVIGAQRSPKSRGFDNLQVEFGDIRYIRADGARFHMSGKDPKTGQFVKGNRFWEARSSHGPKPKFDNPDDLWNACVEYFEWNEDNPLIETKGFAFQGKVTKETFPKMRAMTIAGLCMFLDVTERQWREWRDSRSDLLPVITRAESVIFKQKFEGASADMLNANIIARDLGLAEKRDHQSTDGSMTPKPALDLSRVSEADLEHLERIANAATDTSGAGET